MSLAYRTCSALFVASLCVVAAATWTESRAQGTSRRLLLEEFDVPKDGDVLLLPVTIQGHKYYFVLDTGANITVYDRSLKPLLGHAIGRKQMNTPSQSIETELFEAPEASFGSLPVPTGCLVAVADLSLLRIASGYDIQGIVGMDFLRRYVIRIDCDVGSVEFLRAVPSSMAVPLPLVHDQQDPPRVVACLPGFGPAPFVIDTGSIGSETGCLTADIFDALTKVGKIRTVASGLVTGMSGTDKERRGTVDAFELGPWKHQNLLFGEQGYNLLGLGFWSRYIVTFDFPNRKLYLEEGKNFDHPCWRDMSGLTILRVDGQTIVHSVAPGSPAASAGIKPRDILLQIDGKAADQSSLFTLRRLLCSGGKKIQVTFKRGRENLEAALVLRTYQQ